MKLTLEINDVDLYLFTQRYKMFSAISDIDQRLRGKLKYGHEYKTIEDAIQGIRDELSSLIDVNELRENVP